MKDMDFRLFVVLWNQRMGQGTPRHHLKMAVWLEEAWVRKDRRLLMMAFRSSGKSTIVGLFCAWLLYRTPELRILVLSSDEALAGKMVRQVKRIIEKHPLTLRLKPDKADQWASDRFTVRRLLELRDPSMLARGISANITGSRSDVVICDDVEVPVTCDTPEKRVHLRERLAEMAYVLVPDGTQLYVGTPHSFYSIYADSPRPEVGETAPFLEGFKRFRLPVLDGEGHSAWPERFSLEEIARMKRATGPHKFASQMLLEPLNIAQGRLDPSALWFYDSSTAYLRELNRLEIDNTEMVSVSAWWDPAFGNGTGDGSVFAVVYTDVEGFYWLHKLAYLRVDPLSVQDPATQQCGAVAMWAKLLNLPCVTLEINGIGKFLPAILQRELAVRKVPCAVKEITSRRPKDLRILEAFDAVLAARALRVHQSVRETPFITEMQEWRPGGRGRDDGLDAVAGALSQEPVRIDRGARAKGGQNWIKGAKAHKAGAGEFGV